MAPNEARHRSRRGHRDKAPIRSDRRGSERNETLSTSAANPVATQPQDIEALRTARLKYLETPEEERRKKMKYVGETVVKSPATKEDIRHLKRTAPRHRARIEPDSKSRQRRVRVVDEHDGASEDEYVYARRALPRKDDDHNGQPRITRKKASVSPQRRTTWRTTSSKTAITVEERRTPPRRHTEPVRRRDSYGIDECAATPESVRPVLRKSATGLVESPRRSMKRSATSIKAGTEVSTARSTAGTEGPRKGSIISSFLRSSAPVVEKKVSCLTCGSDDIPISRSAKLPCSHRMCHTCLKRIFNMSVKDPAHMPPRCCTSEHIDLKHVDKLFDQNFKKTWNHKFQEYTTRNRIYCPSRGCGEWIKPNHIAVEHGRKVGKCKRCSTRVCCICNNKMHISRECPKDPATKQFVEVAKEKGWQRCYSCSAMVELKEGCNHMTCRCTAEFCMVCGLKWKSCDCPWFNYEQVDTHLGNPARYQEELDRRRDQEHRDEAMARRMEVLGLDDDEGVMFGIGNGAGHHMNQNFIQQAREALTANYQHAEQAARGLLTGLMTGRENRLPGLPLPANQTAQVLRQGNMVADPAEAAAAQLPERRPTRRGTVRRQGGIADVFDARSQTANERAQDRRIQDWAHGVPVGSQDA